jgi:hypothetical protein
MVAAALIDPLARVALERWRDGEFKVVLNRDLLALHLKVLHRVGLGPKLARRWTYWFTAPERSIFLGNLKMAEGAGGDRGTAVEICEGLAAAQGAEILCWRRPAEVRNAAAWRTVGEFLQR